MEAIWEGVLYTISFSGVIAIISLAIFLTFNFLSEVPKQLKRIADALEKRNKNVQ